MEYNQKYEKTRNNKSEYEKTLVNMEQNEKY